MNFILGVYSLLRVWAKAMGLLLSQKLFFLATTAIADPKLMNEICKVGQQHGFPYCLSS
jgi:hypothetical protein